jgi:hypothetical protein
MKVCLAANFVEMSSVQGPDIMLCINSSPIAARVTEIK